MLLDSLVNVGGIRVALATLSRSRRPGEGDQAVSPGMSAAWLCAPLVSDARGLSPPSRSHEQAQRLSRKGPPCSGWTPGSVDTLSAKAGGRPLHIAAGCGADTRKCPNQRLESLERRLPDYGGRAS